MSSLFRKFFNISRHVVARLGSGEPNLVKSDLNRAMQARSWTTLRVASGAVANGLSICDRADCSAPRLPLRPTLPEPVRC
jgi:hypothetical protein